MACGLSEEKKAASCQFPLKTAAQFGEEQQGPVLWSAALPGPLSLSVQLSRQTEGQTWGCLTACQV